MRASHILVKHQGSRRTASWKDVDGVAIKTRTKAPLQPNLLRACGHARISSSSSSSSIGLTSLSRTATAVVLLYSRLHVPFAELEPVGII
ncbi:unnamed protein product, partial [Ectocarpus sp. 12 AP-2014]